MITAMFARKVVEDISHYEWDKPRNLGGVVPVCKGVPLAELPTIEFVKGAIHCFVEKVGGRASDAVPPAVVDNLCACDRESSRTSSQVLIYKESVAHYRDPTDRVAGEKRMRGASASPSSAAGDTPGKVVHHGEANFAYLDLSAVSGVKRLVTLHELHEMSVVQRKALLAIVSEHVLGSVVTKLRERGVSVRTTLSHVVEDAAVAMAAAVTGNFSSTPQPAAGAGAALAARIHATMPTIYGLATESAFRSPASPEPRARCTLGFRR